MNTKSFLFISLWLSLTSSVAQAQGMGAAFLRTDQLLLQIHAGSLGGPGYVDAKGTGARFNQPFNTAVDTAGNVYVADRSNHVIRKIAPDGTVTTLAGRAGTPGSADGTGTAARFNAPYDIAVDALGTVYVADTSNSTIRKITPAGIVTTWAGLATTSGVADGSGTAARFNLPMGITVDSTGIVYVSDAGNNSIRKISAAGVVSTFAGSTIGLSGSLDATGNLALFSSPNSLAVTSTSTLYVSDTNNHTIRAITPAGVVTTLAGFAGLNGFVNGTGSAARLSSPNGIAVDSSGNIFVAEYSNNAIRKITAAGVVTTYAGGAVAGNADGTGTAAQFNQPRGLSVDSLGNLYVADALNNLIRKIDPSVLVTTFAAKPVVVGSVNGVHTNALFSAPSTITSDLAGTLYVADTNNQVIRKIKPDGTVSTLAGLAGSTGSADGTGSAARFNNPFSVALDSTGNIYVSDEGNNLIRKITAAGVVTTLAGSTSGSADGAGTSAQFSMPTGLTVDSTGNVFVVDFGNRTIRKITPAGVVTTFAGMAGMTGTNDGTGTAARFFYPWQIAIDASNNLYLTDIIGQTIRKITSAGVVTTFAGLALTSGSTDGPGTSARFNNPAGIAVDNSGSLFVADQLNATVRKITPAGLVSTVVGVAGTTGVILKALPASLASPVSVAVSRTALYMVSENSILWCRKP